MLASLKGFRRRVGAFIGGFEARLANRRLKGFQPSRAHLNTLIAASGLDITSRARWLLRNNGYAANAIESWAGNVAGSGIKPSSLIRDPQLKTRVQELWLDWTDEADAEPFTHETGRSGPARQPNPACRADLRPVLSRRLQSCSGSQFRASRGNHGQEVRACAALNTLPGSCQRRACPILCWS